MPTINEAVETATSAGISGSTILGALLYGAEVADGLDREHLECRSAASLAVLCGELRGAIDSAEKQMRARDAEGAGIELVRAAGLALVGATMGSAADGLGWAKQWELPR